MDPKPFILDDGRAFASQSEAAAALGVSRQWISQAAKTGRLAKVGTGRAPPPREPKPLTVRLEDGSARDFPSYNAAMRALGVPYSALRRHVQTGQPLERLPRGWRRGRPRKME